MKQTLFLLPKDDSRNSADKQTHKKSYTMSLPFLVYWSCFPKRSCGKSRYLFQQPDEGWHAYPATNKTGKRNDHRLQRNTDHRRQCGRRWND